MMSKEESRVRTPQTLRELWNTKLTVTLSWGVWFLIALSPLMVIALAKLLGQSI